MRIIVSNSTCRNFDNLNEMDKFLQSHKPSEITQNEIHNLNCSSSLNKFILYLETFWKGKKKNTPGQNGSTGKLCQIFKEEIKNYLQSLSESRRGRSAFQLILRV